MFGRLECCRVVSILLVGLPDTSVLLSPTLLLRLHSLSVFRFNAGQGLPNDVREAVAHALAMTPGVGPA